MRTYELFWQSADRSVALVLAFFEAVFVWQGLRSHSPMIPLSFFSLAFAILLAALIFRAKKREAKPPSLDGLIGLCVTFAAPALYKRNEFVIDNDVASLVYSLSILFYFMITLWGYIALKKSIAILPGNRPIIASGPYKIVRHPIYSAFFHISVCNLAFSPSLRNLLATILFGVGIVLRVQNEERILVASPRYQELQALVPARFSTLLFSLPAVVTISLLSALQFS